MGTYHRASTKNVSVNAVHLITTTV
jgi:hypothetical protein